MSWWKLPNILLNAVVGGNEEQKKVDFKMHVAIDFGTHGCALAYAYKDQVYPYSKWGSTKPENNIILNDKNCCVHFGKNATLQFCDYLK